MTRLMVGIGIVVGIAIVFAVVVHFSFTIAMAIAIEPRKTRKALKGHNFLTLIHFVTEVAEK